MTDCFIASCILPATEFVWTRATIPSREEPVCQPHYDAIMLVLGEQAGRDRASALTRGDAMSASTDWADEAQAQFARAEAAEAQVHRLTAALEAAEVTQRRTERVMEAEANRLRDALGFSNAVEEGNGPVRDFGGMSYDDDRPGMMRIHIAERRAIDLCTCYTRDALRAMAKSRGISTGGDKRGLAFRLAQAGLLAPGYDKAGES